MPIECAGRSHVGMRREHNEDSYLLLPEQGLFVIADGMGGHERGEVASSLAVGELSEFFTSLVDQDDTLPERPGLARPEERRLVSAIQAANSTIFERGKQDPFGRRMGTTVAALLLTPGRATVAWAGDSRCYRFRDGALELLTEDHSLLNEFIRTRNPSREEIESFPHKNVIVRAVGMREGLDVDVVSHEVRPGDVFLLCSDGLTGVVRDEGVQDLLAMQPSLDKAAEQLVDLANAGGGADNVTVVLVRVTAG